MKANASKNNNFANIVGQSTIFFSKKVAKMAELVEFV